MSPVTSPRAVAAELTRSRLIDAAIMRFAADGLGASFDTVAADAGVTKGALYHHFTSKQGLIEAVYREAIQRHAARVVEESSGGDGRARLRGLIDSSFALYSSGTPFYGLLWQLHAAAARRPELSAIAERSQRNQREYLEAIVRRGQADGSLRPGLDPEALAVVLNSAIVGVLLGAPLSPSLLSRIPTLLEDLLQ